MHKALIFGVAGQDGAYLSKLLLDKGYDVYGVEKKFIGALWRFKKVGIEGVQRLHLLECDIADPKDCQEILTSLQPDEIYNFAAQSSVALSFKEPEMTIESTAFGASNLFEAVRLCSPHSHLFQASSADMFGRCGGESLKSEASSLHPQSPYGVAKVFAHQLAGCYRNSYGLHFSCGILFNHESGLRTDAFVTMKIAKAAALASAGAENVLELGNIDAKRDWGYAPEYVEAMHKMTAADKADDYVIATGRLSSVRDFIDAAYMAAGINIEWHGSGIEEKGYDRSSGRLLVRVDPQFFRPLEVDPYGGDAGKIYKELGWKANVALRELCAHMVESSRTL